MCMFMQPEVSELHRAPGASAVDEPLSRCDTTAIREVSRGRCLGVAGIFVSSHEGVAERRSWIGPEHRVATSSGACASADTRVGARVLLPR